MSKIYNMSKIVIRDKCINKNSYEKYCIDYCDDYRMCSNGATLGFYGYSSFGMFIWIMVQLYGRGGIVMTFQDYLNGQKAKYARLVVVAGKVASKVGGMIDEASFREFVNYEESIEWSIDVKTYDERVIRVKMDSYCDDGLYEVSYKEFRLTEDGKAFFFGHLDGDDYPCFCDEDGRTYGFDEAENMQNEWRMNNKN